METQTQRSNSIRRLLSKNFKGIESQFLQFLDAGKAAAEKNLWFFEIAWEVANQGKLTILLSINSWWTLNVAYADRATRKPIGVMAPCPCVLKQSRL